MLDPILLLVALFVMLVVAPSLGISLLLAWFAFWMGGTILLSLYESFWWSLGDPTRRALLRLRWTQNVWLARLRRKQFARALISTAGLELDATDTARLGSLCDAVHAMNAAVPTTRGEPLSWEYLLDSLEPSEAYRALFLAAWRPPPPLTGLSRRIADLRGAIGGLMTWHDDVRRQLSLVERAARRGHGDDRVRYVMAQLHRSAARVVAPPVAASFPQLLLTDQRGLGALIRVLYGTPQEAAWARFLNPTMSLGLANRLRGGPEALAELRAAMTSAMGTAPASTANATGETVSAIAMHRVWPPGGTAKSQLGGLPLLASPDHWPRNPDTGRPLHLVARLHCRELPEVEDLPSSGSLQFFVDLGEEGPLFGRVLHVDGGTEQRPPADLPAIAHLLDRRVFAAWPLAMGPVGEPVALPPPVSTDPLEKLDVHALPGFPYCGLVVRRLARLVRSDAGARCAVAEDTLTWATGIAREHALEQHDRAESHIHAIDAVEAAIGPVDRLATVIAPAPLMAWLETQPERFRRNLVIDALRETLEIAVTDAELRAVLPDSLWDLFAAVLLPRAQSPHLLLTPFERVRLLRLESDPGINMLFDGAVEFWISPADLEAGRWEAAHATMC